MFFFVDFASPSALRSTAGQSWLDVRCNERRPVRFSGHVKSAFVPDVRFALRALGELVWSGDYWSDFGGFFDPVVTVAEDRLCFEAFAQDQSAFGAVIIDRQVFDLDGPLQAGTTNIDFSAWLWAALGELRTSRKTKLSIGAAGVEVATQGSGARFEKKVEVPGGWVRGFLELQAAASMPGTKLRAKPADLLHAIRYLKKTKAKVSPRALRYEFVPGQEAQLVLEPFEYAIPLRGSQHGRSEFFQVRTWGRRRLRLIEPLLPYATSVDIHLKGRAQPSFYVVHLQPGVRFVLGLSGWSRQGFSASRGAVDALGDPPEQHIISCLRQLQQNLLVRPGDCPGLSEAEAAQALRHLCRRGRAGFDLEGQSYRLRELFDAPLDMAQEAEMFPPDEALKEAKRFQERQQIRVTAARWETMLKERSYKTPEGTITREVAYEDWVTEGRVAGQDTSIKCNRQGRIIFGQCTCQHFSEHLMNQGPCSHMLALQLEAPLEEKASNAL